MNKKLRLLVTAHCHNSCPKCCNKQFDLNSLPVVDRWDYDEVCITGGEPLISLKKTRRLIRLIEGIREIWKATGHEGKIYVYSATRKGFLLARITPYVDGIVYTPHCLQEISPLASFSRWVVNKGWDYPERNKSFRLNVFPDMMPYLEQLNQDRMKIWKIKQIEWVDNCPIPEGEDFRRIHNMY